jgi:hypothetical protein
MYRLGQSWSKFNLIVMAALLFSYDNSNALIGHTTEDLLYMSKVNHRSIQSMHCNTSLVPGTPL